MSSIEKLEKIIQYVEQYSSLVETCAEDIKRDLEVLDIIRNKKVNVWAISIYKNAKGYNQYRTDGRELTDDEFEILKDWYERE